MGRQFFLFLLFVFLSFGIYSSLCAAAFDTTRELVVPKVITDIIVVDGKLNEAVWHQAALANNFRQILPEHNQKPTFSTEVRLIHNSEFLFIGVFCSDTATLVYSNVHRDFNESQMDFFGVVMDGFNDGRTGMAFLVNPGGAQKDLMVFDDIHFDVQWDGLWTVRTSRNDSGWVAEIAIPWQTLRFKNNNGNWKINFFRRMSSKNEFSAWALYPRFASPYRLQFAGIMKVMPPKSQTNFRIQPYSLSQLYQSHTESGKLNKTTLNTGVDMKWAMSPKDVLDITVNTDFAQADIDRHIINLTRSSIYLPERRAFFQENASLFSEGMKADGPIGETMQIIPFLSRRVGLDSNGGVVPIKYGSRYVHRSSKSNYGLMYIRQGEQNRSRSFLISRFSTNLGRQNRIGMLHSSDIMNNDINSTTSADVFIRIKENHSIKAMLSNSYGSNEKLGLAQFVQYDYKSNKMIAALRQAYVSEQYNPRNGFVSRNDVLYFGPMTYLTIQPKWMPSAALFYEPVLMGDFFIKASTGVLQEYRLTGVPLWFTFRNGSAAAVFGFANYQNVENAISILGISIQKGKYRYYQAGTILNTSPFNKWSIQSVFMYGGFYNGTLLNADLSIHFRSSEKLSMMTQIQSFILKRVGYSNASTSIHLLFKQLRYAITPRMIVSSMTQFNLQNRQTGINLRYAWEFRPLSFVYFIYSFNEQNRNNFLKQEQGFIAKISYIHQF